MNAARRIRAEVDQAGGELRRSVRQIRDAFGVSRLTNASRRRIADDLTRAGLETDPPFVGAALDDHVTITALSTGVHPRSLAGNAAVARARTGWSRRRRGVLAGAVVGLVVILIAAVFGGSEDGGRAPSPPEYAAVGSSPPEAAQTPAEATRLLGEAEALIAAYDPIGARRLLGGVDDAVIAANPGVATRLTRARRLNGLATRYVAATDLAARGSYVPARRGMLALAPFRNATRMADGYGLLAARELVAQARETYSSRPARSLDLLDRAERLAPGLESVATVRALARDRQDLLSAPPVTTPVAPPTSDATSACDPEYSGACIPDVPYDLDCGDVAAQDFSSVGSDPNGFDREGDGLACES